MRSDGGRDRPGCPQPSPQPPGADLAGSAACSSLSFCPRGARPAVPAAGARLLLPLRPHHGHPATAPGAPAAAGWSWEWGRSPQHPGCSSWWHCSRSPGLLERKGSRGISSTCARAGNDPRLSSFRPSKVKTFYIPTSPNQGEFPVAQDCYCGIT